MNPITVVARRYFCPKLIEWNNNQSRQADILLLFHFHRVSLSDSTALIKWSKTWRAAA